MKREQIRKRMAEIVAENKGLIVEYQELQKQDMLCSDEIQWFTEEEEDVIVKKRPKVVEKRLIGKIHWKEQFKDDDTGEYITIQRTQIVRINGQWI